jgi:3-oxo-5-alpha-steroid 4-dehydrogenase 1
LLSCFLLHYFNRAIIFPCLVSGGNPMPISVMLLGGLYCAWNGFNQSAYLIGVHGYEDSWLVDPRFIIGIALFFSGMIINIQSDNTLFVLKKASTNANGTKRYGIPKGGMFEYVSAANYCKC